MKQDKLIAVLYPYCLQSHFQRCRQTIWHSDSQVALFFTSALLVSPQQFNSMVVRPPRSTTNVLSSSVQYKMDLKVDKAHEKFEQKAALAVEHAELKKAAVQEEAEEKIVAAMEKAEHVRAGEEVLKPSLAQKVGLKKKDF